MLSFHGDVTLDRINDGEREPDGGQLSRTGGRFVDVRAVVSGLLAHHPHLHPLVGPEDDSPDAPGLPLGV